MEGSNISLLIKKFSRYKVGLTFFWILVAIYIIIILGGFISPYTAGTPYQGEAAQGGKARDLYTYYKSKTMHPPTPINFEIGENGLRAFSKEYKRLERPGYNIFIELGVERTIGGIIDFIKEQSIEPLIDNFPVEEKEKEVEITEEIDDGVFETYVDIEKYNYPTYLIDITNKLPNDIKGNFIKSVNSSQNQKQYIAEILIQTIDEESLIRSTKRVISSNFALSDFRSIIINLIDNENLSDKEVVEIYQSDFNTDRAKELGIAEEITRQKQGMVLDLVLKDLGAGGISTKMTTEQYIKLFDGILENMDDNLKKDIYIETKTYKMNEDTIGFEGNIEYIEELLDAYNSLDSEIKDAAFFEVVLNEKPENFPDIIKEAIMKYLELEVPDMTLSAYYNALRNTDYYNNIPDDVTKEFRNKWIRDKSIRPLKNELYKDIKDQLPVDFVEIIDNSPAYINTTLHGFIKRTPDYVSEKILADIVKDKIPQELLEKNYESVKRELPDEVVELIEEYKNTDITVKDLIRYVIDRNVIDKELEQSDYTTINSRDELQDMVVKAGNDFFTNESLQIPSAVKTLFLKYVDLSDKTVGEVLDLIPHVCDNKNIPTKELIVVKKYEKLLKNQLSDTLWEAFQSNNKHLLDYLKYYIKQERYQFEHDLGFFVEGEEYQLFWVFNTNIHLFGPIDKGTFYLMGADEQGRDIFSRIIYGGAISMSVGILGMFLSILIAIVIGGIAGYFGGMIDWLVMRICEIVLLFPSFYLLLTLRGILPTDLAPTERFILIIVILSFMQWAGTARVIRGFILSGKNQDFVTASKVSGIPTYLVIIKHLLPQISSWLIVRISIGIPGYIIYETSLSYLGFGISEPSVSWGLMLSVMRELSIISVATDYPWLLWPAFVVVIAVMCFQIIGDALRDTLDPMVKR
jgi:peptide/nickel transport system permease protein